jgi:predicted hydrocarbon binding protein
VPPLRPNSVVNMYLSPSNNLFQISATLKDDPSSVSNILQFLSPLGKIKRVEVERPDAGGAYDIVMYFEAVNASVSKQDVRDAIASSPFVVSSAIEQSHNGLLLNLLQFPIRLTSGFRAFVINQEVLNGMLSSIRKKFGSGGDVIIYDEGLALGEEQGKTLVKLIGRNQTIESATDLVKLYQSVGLGRPVDFELNASLSRVGLSLYDSLECQGQRSKVPYSQFIRGHVCGLAAALFGKQMKCAEVRCIATGDAYCRFVASPA